MYEAKETILKIGDVVSVSIEGLDIPAFIERVRYGRGSRLEIEISIVSSAENQKRWMPLERAIYPLLDGEGCLIGYNIQHPAINFGGKS